MNCKSELIHPFQPNDINLYYGQCWTRTIRVYLDRIRPHIYLWLSLISYVLVTVTDSKYTCDCHWFHTYLWLSLIPHILVTVIDFIRTWDCHWFHTYMWLSLIPHVLVTVTDSTHTRDCHWFHTYLWLSLIS